MNSREVKMHQAQILHNAGHKQKDIAEQLGVSDRMVRKYLKQKEKPTEEKQEKPSILAPYHDYISAKINDIPNYNLVVLHKELVKQGYSGGMTIL